MTYDFSVHVLGIVITNTVLIDLQMQAMNIAQYTTLRYTRERERERERENRLTMSNEDRCNLGWFRMINVRQA